MPGFPSSTRVFGKDPSPSQCPEPIAIVGMACRWPGEASNTSKLWDLLEQERSGYRDFEANKINLEGFYHPNQHRPGSMFTKGGYLLKEDPKQFDHNFFGVTPVETMTMDPAQRKLLEVTYEAFENAGESWDSFSGSKTGVFVGNFNYDHQLAQVRDADHTLPYVTTGGGITILSNRINYVFNLHGPSMTLDTACSSSMYALHLAVSSIRSGECASAIVGGSNLILGPEAQLFSTKLGAISPTSTCHTFDAAADGYARADGFGVLYIKRLSDALNNKDPIRAVIRSTAINANGKTGGISHPSPEGQEAVIRRAYEAAGGLDPDLTGYFECHGTGTAVGDPLEVAAVGRVFSSGRTEEPLLIGSIKPNLGHSESSSGLAGVMKAVLAIEHGQIPATIGLVNPNPNIDFDGARVKVVQRMTSWPASKPIKRASVNSFGYGGANAHCILEGIDSFVPGYRPYASRSVSKASSQTSSKPSSEFSTSIVSSQASSPPQTPAETDMDTMGLAKRHGKHPAHDAVSRALEVESARSKVTHEMPESSESKITLADSETSIALTKHTKNTRSLVLLPFSGHNELSLNANISSISEVADQYDVLDLAYTLSARRSKFFHRAFAIADADSPAAALDPSTMTTGKSSASIPGVGFIFTGQGAQWAGMGAQLFAEFKSYRQTIRNLDEILAQVPERPGWSLESALLEPQATSRIQEPELSQPLCTALQIAIVDLLSSWNVKPVSTIGHSSGEIAAAYAAGIHTAEEAIIMAYYRGLVLADHRTPGRMLAVGLSPENVGPYLEPYQRKLVIAAVNSPESVTLSGDEDAVMAVKEALDQKKIFARLLQTGGKAYHSHHMAEVGERYEILTDRALQKLGARIATSKRQERALWISSVDPSKIQSTDSLRPAYWRKNLESPVLFSPAVEHLVRNSKVCPELLIEIGPHAALAGPLRQIRALLDERYQVKLAPCLGSIVRGEDGFKNMLSLAGNLFIRNVAVDLVAVNTPDDTEAADSSALVISDLPNYQFDYGPPIYYESRYNKEWRLRKYLRHDILGAKQPGCAQNSPSWRNMLRLKDVPWLDDHKLLPVPIFPAAGYLAMAIEAMSQYHHDTDAGPQIQGFSFRNVAINSTMQIPDDDFGVETILNLQPAQLTISKTSERWHEFRIRSLQNNQWTEHCNGSICVESERSSSSESEFYVDPKSRHVNSRNWYEKFTDIGLGYGPTFQGLSEIRARPSQNRATAAVALHTTAGTVKGGESAYPIHPATIDNCLQLALIASHAGQIENVRHAFVPVVVDEMSLWIPSDADQAENAANGQATGQRRGLRSVYAQTSLFGRSGEVMMDIKQLRCISYDSTYQADTEVTRNPFLRLIWKPDLDSLTNTQARALFPPTTDAEILIRTFSKFDQLAVYILVQIFDVHSQAFAKAHPQHLQRFLDWIQRCVDRARKGELAFGQDAVSASFEERKAVIDRVSSELDTIVEAKLIKRVYDQLEQILSGETSGLHVALKDDLLTELYVSGIGISGGYPQLKRIIDGLAHKRPLMKILEIGAGTGGATRLILETLEARSQFKRYKHYCFTDITTSFFAKAQDEFSDCGDMEYKTLDIEKDPLGQSFEAEYDMIVASQVLHATTTIAETLQHARSLLKPGGKMVLLEITNVHLGTGLVLGTFPDYWNGVSDGRVDSPLLTKAMWQNALVQNGFSGIDILLDDHDDSVTMASVIVSTAVASSVPLSLESVPTPNIVIAHSNIRPSLSFALEDHASEKGLVATPMAIEDAHSIQQGSRLIVLADLMDTYLADMDAAGLENLKTLLHKASTLVWITAGGLINGTKPEHALISGLMRAIVTEMPDVKLVTIDLEVGYDQISSEIADLVLSKEAELQDHVNHKDAIDNEYVLKGGILHVSRLVPDDSINQKFREQEGSTKRTIPLPLKGAPPLGISFEQTGLLSSLYFKKDPEFATPLLDDQVEIEVRAVGLNVKDLAVALGRFDWHKHSTECSGIIAQTGSNVTGLSIGDAVYGAAPGNFGNFVRVQAASVQKMAPTVTFEEAASMPVAFMTAIYAFIHLARLSSGESVLIQSATGGLGMAAIQIAKYLGAEIYATVGNDDKARVLTSEFGIASDHIFNSRELSTPSKILEATNGVGIDVILCSAAGEIMQESWRTIAPMGRFIEVGRTDVLEHGKLSMEIFKRNATFSSFDLGLMNQQKPAKVASLMAELADLHRQGAIQPFRHIQTFDVSNLELAMMQFAKGTHLGKIVVTFLDPGAVLEVRPTPEPICFDPNAAYLLAGCLGGLGRSISLWMVEHGAKNLVYLSRSGANNKETVEWLRDLHSMGTNPQVIICDITSKPAVDAAVQQIQQPIKGVIQAAMVVNDTIFDKMTLSQFKSVTDPKVAGTVNLHEATLDQPLDFFHMTSSIVTMIGTATQGSYCAGNAFQDSFARYRTSLGRPAQAFALGMILEVGFVSHLPEVQKSLMRNGVYGTGQFEFLKLLEASFGPQTPHHSWSDTDALATSHLLTGLEPVKLDALYRKGLAADFTWHTDARFGRLLQALADLSKKSESSKTSNSSVTDALATATPAEFRATVTTAILDRLAKLLFTPSDEMDPARAVSDYGMDSMIAAELRNWFVKNLQTDVTFLELLNPQTKILDLVEKVWVKQRGEQAAETAA